jgi:DtxR family Mn-dependent transcriptional regulator
MRRQLTESQEDYLKALYDLGGSATNVSTSELARRLQVSLPSVTEMVEKLGRQGLLRHSRYRGTTLTKAGQAVAVEMTRHHRLLETYLVEKMGYRWDEVHEEADRLEHAISEQMEARMSDALGHPAIDCHGDPIPDAAGTVRSRPSHSLVEARAGEHVTVRRVSDRDSDVLRKVYELGLILNARVEVVAESLYEGPISIRVDGRRRLIPIGVARAVFVA